MIELDPGYKCTALTFTIQILTGCSYQHCSSPVFRIHIFSSYDQITNFQEIFLLFPKLGNFSRIVFLNAFLFAPLRSRILLHICIPIFVFTLKPNPARLDQIFMYIFFTSNAFIDYLRNIVTKINV